MGKMSHKKVKNRKDTKIPIEAWFVGSFSIVLVVLIVTECVIFAFILEPIFIHEGKSWLQKGFYLIEDSYDENDHTALKYVARELENKFDIKMTTIDEEGNIFSSTYTLDLFPDDYSSYYQDDQNKAQSTAEYFLETYGKDFPTEPEILAIEDDDSGTEAILMGSFVSNGKTVYVILQLTMDAISYSRSVFTEICLIVSLIGLVLTAILLYFISKGVTRQIKNIEVVAQNISELKFDSYADETQKTEELALLAKSINSMSHSLEKAVMDLKVANKSLQEDIDAQKDIQHMRKEFISDVSHEMKTPLSLIQLYSENLKNNVDNIDKEYYCDVIIDEVNIMNNLVVSLLDISSIDSGAAKMEFESIDLSTMCDDIVHTFNVMLKDFDVKTDIEDEIIITGDRKYLDKVIKNYILNAIQHTSDGGKITISLKREENKAIFSVRNEGENIPAEESEKIWQAFYKSDKSRKRTPYSSNGLGLYIVKTIIEKHSGEYGFINTEDGVEFYVKLRFDD